MWYHMFAKAGSFLFEAFVMEVTMVKSRKYAVVDEKRCVACGECAVSCRKGAASIQDGCFAVIDTASCVGCGLCGKNCPAGCIALVEREVTQNG